MIWNIGKTMSGSATKIICIPECLAFLYPTEIRITENDTYRILGGPKQISSVGESYTGLINQALEAAPIPAGSLLRLKGKRRSFSAIVYDLDQDPICDPDWLASILDEIFKLTNRDSIKSIAMPVMGIAHSRLDAGCFLRLFRQSLANHQNHGLELIVFLDESRKPSRVFPPFAEIH